MNTQKVIDNLKSKIETRKQDLNNYYVRYAYNAAIKQVVDEKFKGEKYMSVSNLPYIGTEF